MDWFQQPPQNFSNRKSQIFAILRVQIILRHTERASPFPPFHDYQKYIPVKCTPLLSNRVSETWHSCVRCNNDSHQVDVELNILSKIFIIFNVVTREKALQAAEWRGPHSLWHNFIMNFHDSFIFTILDACFNIEVSAVELRLPIIISYLDSSCMKTNKHWFSLQLNEV